MCQYFQLTIKNKYFFFKTSINDYKQNIIKSNNEGSLSSGNTSLTVVSKIRFSVVKINKNSGFELLQ